MAGDGTTTATVLAEAIFNEGLRAVVSGANPMLMKRGMEKAVEDIIAKLKADEASTSRRKKDLENVATVASNNDRDIGKIIAEAMDKVGKDGVITVEEGKTTATDHEFVEGMQFDRGYLSPYFVTDPQKMECELEDPYILIYEKKISSNKDLVPVLEKVLQPEQADPDHRRGSRGRGAGHAGHQQAARHVQVRRRQGAGLRRSPQGHARRHRRADRRPGHLRGPRHPARERRRCKQLGRAKKVKIDKDNTTIIEGAGKKARRSRAASQLIQRELEKSTSDYDKEKLSERIAKLSGGVAKINVGAATESEMKEKKARVEDAMHATRAANQEGILPGGGVALLRASTGLKPTGELPHDEEVGYNIVVRACRSPIQQIAENAGEDGAVVMNKVLESKDANYGYDARLDRYCDMVKEGIIDPTKVVRSALQNAASVATLLLTSDALVADVPKDEKKGGGGRRHGRHVLKRGFTTESQRAQRRQEARFQAVPATNPAFCLLCALCDSVVNSLPAHRQVVDHLFHALRRFGQLLGPLLLFGVGHGPLQSDDARPRRSHLNVGAGELLVPAEAHGHAGVRRRVADGGAHGLPAVGDFAVRPAGHVLELAGRHRANAAEPVHVLAAAAANEKRQRRQQPPPIASHAWPSGAQSPSSILSAGTPAELALFRARA